MTADDGGGFFLLKMTTIFGLIFASFTTKFR